METKLVRIAEIAKREPKERFTSLYHLLNVELLRQAHEELDPKKATGVDLVTKGEYEQNLKSFTMEQFIQFLKRNPLPEPKIYNSFYR